MYSRYILLSALLVIGAETYAKNNKTEVASLLSYNDSEGNAPADSSYQPEFGISDSRFSCYARFPIGAYYICPPNNMDGKMQGL